MLTSRVGEVYAIFLYHDCHENWINKIIFHTEKLSYTSAYYTIIVYIEALYTYVLINNTGSIITEGLLV